MFLWSKVCIFVHYYKHNFNLYMLFGLKAVKAGQAGKVVPAFIDVDIERLSNHPSISDEKKFFCVIGESLAPENIHTNNILIADIITPTYDTSNLEYGAFVIFHIPSNGESENVIDEKNIDLKIRKFIRILDLTENVEDAWAKVREKDPCAFDSTPTEMFRAKYQKAQERISNSEKNNVLISITYTAENGREYSFHSRKRLYAKVVSVIDNNNEIRLL